MPEKRLLYFALGVLFVVAVGQAAMTIQDDGLQFPDGSVQRTAAEPGQRRFYLTNLGFQGDEVLGNCDTGFHVASRYELILGAFRYAFDHPDAFTRADSGQGEPNDVVGWIRTGGEAASQDPVNFGDPLPNCGSMGAGPWTSFSGADKGNVRFLGSPDFSRNCDAHNRIWCIED